MANTQLVEMKGDNKILAKREKWFAGIDSMSEEEIQNVSRRWHAFMDRYITFVGKIQLRELENEDVICN